MTRVGYHCSHEQHSPRALLEHAVAAERAGFEAVMCSDHLMPWSAESGQGHSGFAWSWLGAAMHATRASFGTVNAPGQRYHPAIIAQAIATLAEMFPDRLWVAMGTGEAVNEAVVDERWPSKPERRERLRECVDIVRALLAGETVTHRGHVRVRDAKLYSRPRSMPPLFGAALTKATAAWAGAWADGLITVGAEPEALRAVVETFRDAAAGATRGPAAGGGGATPVFVQVVHAYATTEREAEQIARAWGFSAVGDSDYKADTTRPEYFDAAVRGLSTEQLRTAVRISTSVDRHVEWVARDLECGVDRVYVHHAGSTDAQQQRFLDEVAPRLVKL